jgi:adenosylcobinamide-phosphate synthase
VIFDGASNPGALAILVSALVLDGALPERRWPFPWPGHPVRFLGAVIAYLDRVLNRPERGPAGNLAWGGVAALTVVACAVLAGLALHRLANAVPFGWIVELAAVVALLAQRSLFAHVRRVEDPLARGDLEGARRAVSHIVGRDPRSLDRHGVARAATESLVENFSDGVIAPALFYAFFGLPGLFAYKAANTLDSMIGHRSPRHLYFGRISARLDDALNFIPARISAALLAAAAFFVARCGQTPFGQRRLARGRRGRCAWARPRRPAPLWLANRRRPLAWRWHARCGGARHRARVAALCLGLRALRACGRVRLAGVRLKGA